MIQEKACRDETNTNVSASERCSHPRPEGWFRILITIMTFFLGLAVLMDSEALIGLA